MMAEQNRPEYSVLSRLLQTKRTITFAESCTGGLAAARLIDVPSASAVFRESFVTYSNEAKEKRLHVSPRTIEQYGVVSEQVAGEMAKGAAVAAGADVAVGISGIAGPDGGTKEKPVGMVCFGFYADGRVTTATRYFGAIGREKVRNSSVNFVFDTLLELI